MTRPITVGLDGSPESMAAADWAAREALRRGLPLRLVHAWEGLPADDEPVTLPELRVPQYWARRILRGAQDRLGERYPQLYISAEQLRKPPVPALVEAAMSAELLALGNQGLGGVGGMLAGSVALASVAQVRRPVVLVRAGAEETDGHVPDVAGSASRRTPYREVLVALDLGGTPDPLLEFAFEAARARGALLRALYAWHLPPGHGDGSRRRAELPQREAVWALDSALEPWREKYPTVRVAGCTDHARPGQAVLSAAREAGLLVVGRRVRRSALGTHTGRITHLAIRHVRCPVAVIAHD
ncbi:universal stress protein [Streptomyces mesophilus]|uniref:universal stress protein n=1 Tax=Streptomyces mesophilus TaxID=1775132 RepID=UPI00332219F5